MVFLINVTAVLLLLAFSPGSQGGALPDNAELMEQSLAAVNMRRFHETLLKDALFPDNASPSAEQLQRALESAEGQEIARSAAMQAMLEETRGNSGEKSRAMFWLSSMCDSVPWLAWLVPCDEDNNAQESERENPTIPHPFYLSLQNFQWAICREEM